MNIVFKFFAILSYLSKYSFIFSCPNCVICFSNYILSSLRVMKLSNFSFLIYLLNKVSIVVLRIFFNLLVSFDFNKILIFFLFEHVSNEVYFEENFSVDISNIFKLNHYKLSFLLIVCENFGAIFLANFFHIIFFLSKQ